MLKLLKLLGQFDGALISGVISAVSSVQDKLEDGLTREELDQLLSEFDALADYSQTDVDDDLIQFVQRLVRDPFVINYIFTRVGFEGRGCEACPDWDGDFC